MSTVFPEISPEMVGICVHNETSTVSALGPTVLDETVRGGFRNNSHSMVSLSVEANSSELSRIEWYLPSVSYTHLTLPTIYSV